MTETHALIILNAVYGIGNRTILRLVKFFGSAFGVLQAAKSELTDCGFLNAKQLAALSAFPQEAFLQSELDNARRHRVSITTLFDENYPEPLKNIPDAPVVLYVKGDLPKTWERSIAIVGSRQASLTGQSLASAFARQLGERGFKIISGLAKGIDRAAHEGCLNVAATTVAVIGCGLEHTYPSEHENLFQRIEASGAIISEFPMGTLPLPFNFPRRNRIISGLCEGVLVVEAAAKSGALITADFANEQGKNVYAMPGAIDKPGSAGTNALIKEGAKMVTCLDDILEDYQMEAPLEPDAGRNKLKYELSKEEETIYHFINDRALHLDEIIKESGLHTGGVARVLLTLELKNLITQLPGKHFRRAQAHE